MLSLRTLLAAAVPATAYITGLTAPETATAGSTLTATLSTGSYPQNWDDFGIVWGLQTPQTAASCDTCVGTQIGYTALTGDEGNAYPYTFTEEVQIPEGTAAGDYVLSVAIPYLVGASGMMGFNYYNANITIS